MEEVIRIIWKCKKCNDIVVSYSKLRHNMTDCDCGESGVDLEKEYTGIKGEVEILSEKQNINGNWVKINN